MQRKISNIKVEVLSRLAQYCQSHRRRQFHLMFLFITHQFHFLRQHHFQPNNKRKQESQKGNNSSPSFPFPSFLECHLSLNNLRPQNHQSLQLLCKTLFCCQSIKKCIKCSYYDSLEQLSLIISGKVYPLVRNFYDLIADANQKPYLP